MNIYTPSPSALEVLWQLFRDGPTWDGNICSKVHRGELFEAGYAARVNGWTFLTKEGMEFCVRTVNYGDKKERWDNRRRRAAA